MWFGTDIFDFHIKKPSHWVAHWGKAIESAPLIKMIILSIVAGYAISLDSITMVYTARLVPTILKLRS